MPIFLQMEVLSWLNVIIPLAIVILSVYVIDYYIESVAANHMHPSRLALYSAASMFGAALLLSYVWNHPYMARTSTLHKLKDIITEDHALSGGVIFSVLIFVLGKEGVVVDCGWQCIF
jgi:zinc transporter 5/7